MTEEREAIEPAAAHIAAARATGQDLGRIQESDDAMRRAAAGDIEASVTADEAFHLAVLAASHNAVVINIGAMIRTALRNAFRLTTSATENYAATLNVHGEVLEAIRMRRPGEAGQCMSALLKIASEDLVKATFSG